MAGRPGLPYSAGPLTVSAVGGARRVTNFHVVVRDNGDGSTSMPMAYVARLGDAQLYAAAPEMAEALKAVVDHWTAQFERQGHSAPDWCKKARAALMRVEHLLVFA